jgi:large subunit ribosomal protein L18
VFKSLKYIYAQVIDDDRGTTLAQASSSDQEIRGKLKAGNSSREAARLVGEVVAERAKECGVKTVVFDRGGYVYHGKVKELADGARSKGLQF